MKKIHQFLKPYYLIIVIVLIWYLGNQQAWWSTYLLPGPQRVSKSFITLLQDGSLLKHTLISLRRAVSGFVFSVMLAVPAGIFLGIYPKAYQYWRGIFELLRNTPPLAFIPLLILWFGIGELSKLILIILVAFFPVFLNTVAGVQSIDYKLIEAGQMFGLSRKRIFREIVIPSALPDIIMGMRIGLGYSWRSIISAEMIASSSGLGYLILDGQQLSRIDLVLCGIIVIGILGISGEYLLSRLSKPFLAWRHTHETTI